MFVSFYVLILLFFWLDPKERKDQGKHNSSACFAGPAHWEQSLEIRTYPLLQYFVLVVNSAGAVSA